MSTEIRFGFNYERWRRGVRSIDGALVAVAGVDSLMLRSPLTFRGQGYASV